MPIDFPGRDEFFNKANPSSVFGTKQGAILDLMQRPGMNCCVRVLQCNANGSVQICFYVYYNVFSCLCVCVCMNEGLLCIVYVSACVYVLS